MALVIVAIVVVIAWLAIETRTRRPDGTYVRVHPYRRVLGFIMPTRNEAVVYFDSHIDATNLLAYLDDAPEALGAHVTHCVVAAVAVGLAENPKMNRFVVGRRLYQRHGRHVTFSVKRKKLDREAKLAAVKLEMHDDETFAGLCARMNGEVRVERSGRKTAADREFALFDALPRPVFSAAFRALRALDYYNVLPGWFIATDPLYTSVFVTNLGSVGMGAGYHHLFEWGTCPLFLLIGQIEEQAVVRDGAVVARPMLHIRYSYDERIDDGLTARFGIEAVQRVIEDPHRHLGCLATDGSDARPLVGRA